MKLQLARISAAALMGLFVAASTASAQCVSGTITSELQTSGPFAGMYKYTVQIDYDIAQGLSNVSLNCAFDCAELCSANWVFDSPPGTNTGDGAECNFDFVEGDFKCKAKDGQPGNVIKWDAANDSDCTSGSATLCFYVDLPPATGVSPIALIKNGQNVCDGELVGDCPICPVAVDTVDWSAFKTMFLW